MKKVFLIGLTIILLVLATGTLLACEWPFGGEDTPEVTGYDVTWVNENGNLLQLDRKVAEGTTPTYRGNTPIKSEDEENTYVFDGWSPAVHPVDEAIVYTATYRAVPKNTTPVPTQYYTITWADANGSVLSRSRVAQNAIPAYTGETPTKAEDEDYTYTFGGWSPTIAAATADAIYRATFVAQAKGSTTVYYHICWLDYDGTQLAADDVLPDTIPAYSGNTPTRQEDEDYTYIFEGWTPTIIAADGNANYTATYTAQSKISAVVYYTITWQTDTGVVLATDSVEATTLPTYAGATPIKAADSNYCYTFDGWTPTIVAAQSNATYTTTWRTSPKSLSLTVYAVNDFHGAIEQSSGQTGLGYFATYFKEKGAQPNTLLIDSGDTWQGSIYSNYNHGHLVTDVYNAIEMDVRTVGNHDFDWGLEALYANTNASEYTTTLGANIYNYNFATKTVGNVQQSSIADKHAVFTLENGLKVGVVGVIGADQITTINSIYVQEIAFKEHIPIIKQEANYLRQTEGCDVVILSIHGGQEDVLGNNLSDYVDLVLCAHTHQLESTTESGLLYAQFGSYGKYFGQITLTVDMQTHKVNSQMTVLDADDVVDSVSRVDSTVQGIINQYKQQCDAEANTVVARTSGTFSGTAALANLMCKALYDQCVKQGYNDIYLTYVNNARATLYGGQWTYADLYKAFPFDNEIYIIEVTGNELLNEVAKYNYIYKPDASNWNVYTNRTYRIAVIDYLVFHTNKNRYYDYFPTNAGNYVAKLEGNYRVLLRDWLAEKGYITKTLYASDYATGGNYQRTNLTRAGSAAATLPTEDTAPLDSLCNKKACFTLRQARLCAQAHRGGLWAYMDDKWMDATVAKVYSVAI